MQKMQKHRYNLNPISESIWFICSLNKADIYAEVPQEICSVITLPWIVLEDFDVSEAVKLVCF